MARRSTPDRKRRPAPVAPAAAPARATLWARIRRWWRVIRTGF